MSFVEKDMQWNSVIKEAVDNLEYWTQELQEPALLFLSARGEVAPPWAHQQRDKGTQTGQRQEGRASEEEQRDLFSKSPGRTNLF